MGCQPASGMGFQPMSRPVFQSGLAAVSATSGHPTRAMVRRRRGFTLLEVIVAMMVLAIGITGALMAVSACMRNMKVAEEYSRAANFAQQVAALLERNASLSAGSQSGTFSDQSTGPDDSVDTAIGNPVRDFTWSAAVSPADGSGCYPVQITVTWDTSRQYPQQYQLNTVLLPQQPPSATPPTVPGTIAPATTGSGGTAMPTSGGGSSPAAYGRALSSPPEGGA